VTEQEFEAFVAALDEEAQILVATVASMGFPYHQIQEAIKSGRKDVEGIIEFVTEKVIQGDKPEAL